jgi:hypothetical protein
MSEMKAWVGGRRLTLDPVMEVVPMEIHPRRIESSIPCGFQAEWIDGEDNDPDSEVQDFNLSAGAGWGSAYMVLTVRMKDGPDRIEVVDVREFLPQWITRVIEAGPTPEATT